MNRRRLLAGLAALAGTALVPSVPAWAHHRPGHDRGPSWRDEPEPDPEPSSATLPARLPFTLA